MAQSTTLQIGCTNAMNSISRAKASPKPNRAMAAKPVSVSFIESFWQPGRANRPACRGVRAQ
jgi:hypothetical protein